MRKILRSDTIIKRLCLKSKQCGIYISADLVEELEEEAGILAIINEAPILTEEEAKNLYYDGRCLLLYTDIDMAKEDFDRIQTTDDGYIYAALYDAKGKELDTL